MLNPQLKGDEYHTLPFFIIIIFPHLVLNSKEQLKYVQLVVKIKNKLMILGAKTEIQVALFHGTFANTAKPLQHKSF